MVRLDEGQKAHGRDIQMRKYRPGTIHNPKARGKEKYNTRRKEAEIEHRKK